MKDLYSQNEIPQMGKKRSSEEVITKCFFMSFKTDAKGFLPKLDHNGCLIDTFTKVN